MSLPDLRSVLLAEGDGLAITEEMLSLRIESIIHKPYGDMRLMVDLQVAADEPVPDRVAEEAVDEVVSTLDQPRKPPTGRSRTTPAAGRGSSQIKTRDRVRDLAEVYTDEREVNAMLDLVPDMFPAKSSRKPSSRVEKKFLEPACGNGNFLVEILARKMVPIRWSAIDDQETYEHWLLRALASIYAVDIDPSNVEEARERVLSVLLDYYRSDAGQEPTPAFEDAAKTVLTSNVLLGNTLTDASTMAVIDYVAGTGGTFTRTWSALDDSDQDPSDTAAMAPRRDEVSVHYSQLAQTPDPTVRGAA